MSRGKAHLAGTKEAGNDAAIKWERGRAKDQAVSLQRKVRDCHFLPDEQGRYEVAAIYARSSRPDLAWRCLSKFRHQKGRCNPLLVEDLLFSEWAWCCLGHLGLQIIKHRCSDETSDDSSEDLREDWIEKNLEYIRHRGWLAYPKSLYSKKWLRVQGSIESLQASQALLFGRTSFDALEFAVLLRSLQSL